MALLTTEDVLNKKFQYVKFREGYDQDEVDEFLDEVVSTIYSLTDPPIRWLRRFVPPLRLGGGMAIDVGFMLLFLVLIVAQRLAYVLFFISQ